MQIKINLDVMQCLSQNSVLLPEEELMSAVQAKLEQVLEECINIITVMQ